MLLLVMVAQADETDDQQVWVFYLSFWAGESTWEWNETILSARRSG